MTKLQSVADTKWAFYEAYESGCYASMLDQFETLMIHYQNRGKVIEKKNNTIAKILRNFKKTHIRKAHWRSE